MMPTYNSLSLYLQMIINLTLITGLILFIKTGIKIKVLLFIFLFGESALELTDLAGRLMKLNSLNTYNYPLSQFFGLVMITAVYSRYFIKIPNLLKWAVYVYAVLSLAVNIMYIQNIKSVTFYSNIVSSIIICALAGTYFLKIIKKTRIDRNLFSVSISVFLFFSIECLISTTFNFLISSHLEWVAPIWLFRGILLCFFYISFINLGCRIGTIRAR
ncbi:hypothetical protein M2347_000029 [Chryseobacterium sp. H1D6B]|uniref:hypothetical protein n=1 Tax=Chryseobacterium sp. H1D6B TaxID=2940588 RepID=UPI00179E89CC|nr:hypothetical protein [Chryseobacterium sp. H1D6B]MDH6250302.1 hypothetical protein [Chryseobacterium sp. H1D6B]